MTKLLLFAGVISRGLKSLCLTWVFLPLVLPAQEGPQKTASPSPAPSKTQSSPIGSSAGDLPIETQITLGKRAWHFKEYEKSFEYFQAAFTNNTDGDVRAKKEAAYYMGIMYLRGQGQEKDYNKALYWLNSAATSEADPSGEKGQTIVHTAAQYALAQIFLESGEGTLTQESTPRANVSSLFVGPLVLDSQASRANNRLKHLITSRKGLYWLKQAARQAYPPALFDLAQRAFAEKKYKEALRLFARFLNRQELQVPPHHLPTYEKPFTTVHHLADAHYKMGLLSRRFQNRKTRLLKNPEEAKWLLPPEEHFMKAVHLNHHPLACFELGEMEYLKGNMGTAFYWFHKVFFNKNQLYTSEEEEYKQQAAFRLGNLYRNDFSRLPALTNDIQDRVPDRHSLSATLMAQTSLIMRNNKATTSTMVDQMEEGEGPAAFSEAEERGVDPRQEPHRYMADYWLQYAAENGHKVAPALLYHHRYENAILLATAHQNNQENGFSPLSSGEEVQKLQPLWERRVESLLPWKKDTRQWSAFKDFDLPRLMWIMHAALQDHPLAEYEWGQWLFNDQSFKEAYAWFYKAIKSTKKEDKFNINAFHSPDQSTHIEQQQQKQRGEAFFHLAHLVHYQLVPLDYALKNALWSRELATALNVKKFFPLSPARVEEMRFRQMIPYWLKGREDEVRNLFSAFLYKQAHDLGHPMASLHLSAFLKDQELFENRPESGEKSPGRTHLYTMHIFGDSTKSGKATAQGGGRLPSLGNRCRQVFSQIKSKTSKPFTK